MPPLLPLDPPEDELLVDDEPLVELLPELLPELLLVVVPKLDDPVDDDPEDPLDPDEPLEPVDPVDPVEDP